MDWSNYLSEEKCQIGLYAHLGGLEGIVSNIYDLATIPKDTKILSLTTPLKKCKLNYTNWDSLKHNSSIEAIILSDIDEERLAVFATLPNLKYLQISVNRQVEIPDLFCLKHLEVLVLASLKKVQNIDFLRNLTQLKTLYIYGINHMDDLSPLANLTGLEELSLHHGRIGSTGTAVKSMQPLANLTNLKLLEFILTVENKNYDISPLLSLKKLEKLMILPRFLNAQKKALLQIELPLVKNFD